MEILGKSRRADVTFHKSGRIDVSGFAASRIGLRHGDAVNVATVNGRYYMYIACKGERMLGSFNSVCRSTRGHTLRAHNKALAQILIGDQGEKADYASGTLIYVKEYGRMLQINKMTA
ncbi:MAG: hypothetical protein NC102_04360 [Clostridium sp.]|nr:hypothetical protein [Clostridium sp.]